MRRSRSVCLVLLAGGVAMSLAGGCEGRQARQQRECAEARAQLRPDAEQICARSTSRSSGGYGPWFYGRTTGDARTGQAFAARAAAPAVSSRGGFGGSAAAHSAGS